MVFVWLLAGMPWALVAGYLWANPHTQALASGSDGQDNAFQQALVALKENRLELALEKLSTAAGQELHSVERRTLIRLSY